MVGGKWLSIQALETATEQNNSYTLNHIDFNQNCFDLFLVIVVARLVMATTSQNFGIFIKNVQISNFFTISLSFVRACIFTYAVMMSLPLVSKSF